MGYENNHYREQLFDVKEQNLNEKLTTCHKVKNMADMPGWREVIAPRLEQMIKGLSGGKVGNTWTAGSMHVASSQDEVSFLAGGASALIDFYNEVANHISSIERLEDSLKALVDEREGRDTTPMTDGEYA